MKKPTAFVRASHLNTGTGIPEEELAWPETSGRVTRLPRLHVEVADRSTVTPYGGLALASALLRRFRVAQVIDERVHVLKLHLPYHESDHVIVVCRKSADQKSQRFQRAEGWGDRGF